MLQSRNQVYSSVVFPNVEKKAGDSHESKKYKGLCRKAGSLLRTSGLMQMVAFMEARGQRKSEAQYHVFLEDLQQELLELKLITTKSQDKLWLAGYIRTLELPEYMALTRKVLLLITWHKRLAETLIHGDPDDNAEDDET